MIDPEDLSTGEEATPHRRPGRELAAARERAGTALEDMAATLHLAPAQLEALERDDHGRLPPPTFVRGYLRAYAREVGLDPDEVVAAYDASGAPVHDPELRATTPAGAVAAGHGTLIGLVLVVVVAGGGAGAWWLQHRPLADSGADTVAGADAAPEAAVVAEDAATGSDMAAMDAVATVGQAGDEGLGAVAAESESSPAAEPAPIDTSTDVSLSAEAASDDAPGTDTAVATATGETTAERTSAEAGGTDAAATGDSADSANGPAEDSGDATVEAASVPQEAETAAEPEAEVTAAGGTGGGTQTTAAASDAAEAELDGGGETLAAAEDTAAEETTAEPAAEETAAETSGISTVTSSPTAAISAAAATGPDTLVLEFSGNSWLEINDQRGRELAYTLYRGSRPVTVRGWAPFDVFLGNSPAVSVRLNGEEIDKAAFTRSDNTGRFLVDAAGARRR